MPIGERGKITTITDLTGNTYDLGAKYDADGNVISSTYAKLTDIPEKGMVILSYGSSTWAEFKAAYDAKNIVYCRASSNSNPASGSQTRLAFMAYVDNAANPTNVEFQYYRSVSTHSDSQQGDQVYVYKLTNAGAWSVTVRENYTKIAAGKGLSGSWSNGTYTTKADLVSETNLTNAATAATEVAGRVYPVAPDANGKLAVNVPIDETVLEMISGTIWSLSDMQNTPRALSDGEFIIGEIDSGEWALIQIMDDLQAGYDLIAQPMWETVRIGGSLYYIINQLALKENLSNKVTSLSSSSTNTQYPSAKAVYDYTDDNFVSKSGDTMTGALAIKAPNTVNLQINNTGTNAKILDLMCNATNGASGLYDRTNSQWIVYSNSAGNIVYAPGTVSGSLIANGSNGCYVRAAHTGTNAHAVELMAAPGGDIGLYDRTNSAWILKRTSAGVLTIPDLPGIQNSYAGSGINSSVSIGSVVCNGYIDNGSKRVTFLIPYSITGSSITCSELTIRLFLTEGGINPYFRSGSSGGTYTQQSNSGTSIWANSATVRTNEVASVPASIKTRSGIQVVINFNYAICTNNTGTAIRNACPVSLVVTGTFAIS